MIIKGKLIEAKRASKEFGKRTTKDKFWLALADVTLSKEQEKELLDAFKDAGKNFTPGWIKDFKGFVNVSTEFEVPFRDIDGNEMSSLEAAQSNGFKWFGAEVKMSVSVKEGAVYPRSIVFLTEGTAVNAFAEFDEDEE